MTKPLTEAHLTTPNARKKLEARQEPYWRRIDNDAHLGYRRGQRKGVWLVRWRKYPGYRQEPIGAADDAIGEGTISFTSAERKAREIVAAARKAQQAAKDGKPILVRDVVLAYVAKRDAREAARRGRAFRSDAHRLERHVIGREQRGNRPSVPAHKIADIPLAMLDANDLSGWRETLPALSRQRTANDLKAALNIAAKANRKTFGGTLAIVIKDGLETPDDGHGEEGDETGVRENQILSDAQVTRVLRAANEIDAEQGWEGDLYRLVVALASTGARFSQVARMRVGDVQRKASRLMVPTSRKGKGKKQPETRVPVSGDVIEALLPATTGRPADEPLLERWRHEQAAVGEWRRAGRGPWHAASELARAWGDIRTRAKLPDAIPYALRHSSIVRGIREGLPLRLVASLHDTSTHMIERHYSRWIIEGLDELAAKAVVPLLPSGGKVVQLQGRQ